jgi:hypothetical protein
VSSSKITTASTARRAASTAARLCCVVDRALGSLEALDARVGVHAHDQEVALGLGFLDEAHVPGVQDVEAPVGEHDRAARGPHAAHLDEHLLERADAVPGVARELEDFVVHLLERDGLTPKTSTSSPAAALANRTASTQSSPLARDAARPRASCRPRR